MRPIGFRYPLAVKICKRAINHGFWGGGGLILGFAIQNFILENKVNKGNREYGSPTVRISLQTSGFYSRIN